MLTEFSDCKSRLAEALEAVDADLHHHVSVYAVLDTEDPGWPFDIRLVCRAGEEGEQEKLINERLFDRGFLDFGFREVRSEDNLEGISYRPVEDLFSDPSCIGCAPWDFFIEDPTKARMARGMDEDAEDEEEGSYRFALFLKAVQGSVLEGQPSTGVGYDDMLKIKGLLFKYETGIPGKAGQAVVAFQRIQPMWIQQKSSLLLFDSSSEGCEAFASRSLKIGNAFDFLIYDSTLLFRNLKALETLFGFNRLAAQHAKDYADTLDGILADFEKLDERIDASRSVANRLLKIQKEGSPVAELDPEELRYRVSRIGYYSRKIAFNEEGKVMLTTNTNVSDFLKLLSDSFLVSPVSDARYEVKGKTRLEAEGL